MISAGYDLTIEINKNLYNKILKKIFQNNYNLISKKTRAYSFDLSLTKTPVIDSFEKNIFNFDCELSLNSRVLRVLKLNLFFKAYLGVSASFNQSEKKLDVQLISSKIVPANRKNGQRSGNFTSFYYLLLNSIVGSRLLRYYEKIALPAELYAFTLPQLKEEGFKPIDIEVTEIHSLNSEVMVMCINLLGFRGGSLNKLRDITSGQDLVICLSEDALHRVAKYWWNSVALKTMEFEGKFDIKPDFTFDYLTRIGLSIEDVLVKHRLPSNYNTPDWWIEYKMSMKLSEPSLNIKEKNELEIPDLKITLDIDAKIQLATGKSFNKNEDGKSVGEIVTVAHFVEKDLAVIADEAIAKISMDKNFQIVAKIENLDLDPAFDWGVSDEVLDMLIDEIVGNIIREFPSIVLAPTIFNEPIPGTGLRFKFDLDDVKTTGNEIQIFGNLE